MVFRKLHIMVTRTRENLKSPSELDGEKVHCMYFEVCVAWATIRPDFVVFPRAESVTSIYAGQLVSSVLSPPGIYLELIEFEIGMNVSYL